MHRIRYTTHGRIVAGALVLAGLLVTTSAWAIDGAGALGEATGPNGSMNGSIYVPERQATHPRAIEPQQHGRGGYPDYRRPERRRGAGYGRRHGNEYRPRGSYRLDGNTGRMQPNTARPLAPGRVTPNRRRLENRFGD
ncbi:hypothetical protein [Salinisphaera sp. LB1]|uniref:hypothetical protein n=1 Tax=Salinisphaera sp. LB1 TaxID=2183911 RepID=UPI000D7056C4|nr:hypothetical protein [Salinisphaera sp. LB1]AWN14994.1 hypothetical protein SALB1_0787 [Salinisphaera sp. LB1]